MLCPQAQFFWNVLIIQAVYVCTCEWEHFSLHVYVSVNLTVQSWGIILSPEYLLIKTLHLVQTVPRATDLLQPERSVEVSTIRRKQMAREGFFITKKENLQKLLLNMKTELTLTANHYIWKESGQGHEWVAAASSFLLLMILVIF